MGVSYTTTVNSRPPCGRTLDMLGTPNDPKRFLPDSQRLGQLLQAKGAAVPFSMLHNNGMVSAGERSPHSSITTHILVCLLVLQGWLELRAFTPARKAGAAELLSRLSQLHHLDALNLE